MSYQEAGQIFGLSADAMRKRARRMGWRVQAGNDGKARLLVPEGASLSPDGRAGRPAGHPDGRADDLPAELRRQVEALAGELAQERNRGQALAAEVAEQRERAGRAEGEAAIYKQAFENTASRAERAEARAEAEAHAAVEGRQQVTEAMVRVAFLQTERDTALAARDTAQAAAEDAQAAREAAERELAGWAAGGPLARAWRAFWGQRRT